MKLVKPIVLCLLVFFCPALAGDAGFNIELSGFASEQKQSLQQVMNFITSIKPGNLTVNKSSYVKTSRFKELFNIDFNGKELINWLETRITKISYYNSWAAALNHGNGHISLGKEFFNSTLLEKSYILIHEARHSDHHGYSHIQCPDNYPYISASQPETSLRGALACDDSFSGAYAFQAAFLYELFAYKIYDQKTTGHLYNSSLARIISFEKNLREDAHGKRANGPFEFKNRAKVIQRLNQFRPFAFSFMFQTLNGVFYDSPRQRHGEKYFAPYTLMVFTSRRLALESYREKTKIDSQAYFIIGSIVAFCPNGDRHGLFTKLRLILTGMGLKIDG